MRRRKQSIAALITAVLVALTVYLIAPERKLSADGVITSVVDGDTLHMKLEGRKELVRLIGVDAPETASSSRLEQQARTSGQSHEAIAAMGEESRRFLEFLCRGADKVRCETDPANAPSHRDRYGRLLAYVSLVPKDGQAELMVNAELLRQGYARAYTRYRFARAKLFEEHELQARAAQSGLWRYHDMP